MSKNTADPATLAPLRAAALSAADRSNAIEGLPPRDAFARSMDGDYLSGKLSADEVARRLGEHYRRLPG